MSDTSIIFPIENVLECDLSSIELNTVYYKDEFRPYLFLLFKLCLLEN